jgi:GNAT superfamily N-acetyltransferase
MPTGLLPFERFPDLVFRGDPGTNPVRLGGLWHRAGEQLLTDPEDPEGAVLYRRDRWWHLLHNRPEALGRLIAALPSDPEPCFAALPPHQWALVRTRWPRLHLNVHLTLESEPRETSFEGAPIRPLQEGDAAVLLERQPYVEEYGGLDYLLHRIRSGFTAGVEVDRQLVGWEILQDDGTLGFLRVAEPFRRRGYARALHTWLALRVREAGWKAISHVSAHNKRMLALTIPAGARQIGQAAWVRRRSAEEIDALERGEL